jgi:hypothetical protein
MGVPLYVESNFIVYIEYKMTAWEINTAGNDATMSLQCTYLEYLTSSFHYSSLHNIENEKVWKQTNQTTISTVTDHGYYASLTLLVVIWEFIHKNYNYLHTTSVHFLPLLQEVIFEFSIH